MFFQINDVGGVGLFNVLCIKQHLLKQYGVVRDVFRYQFDGLDHTRQATNLGVKSLCRRLRHKSNPYSNEFNSLGPSARWPHRVHPVRF